MKANTDTIISFRISYAKKQELLKVLDTELRGKYGFKRSTISDLIKLALEKTWGVNFYGDETGIGDNSSE